MRRKFIIFFIFCCLIIISACDNSQDTVLPKNYIDTHYKNYEQLNVMDDKQRMLYLLKQNRTYQLLIFKGKDSTFIYEGGIETDAPYGHMKIGTDDSIHVIVFIDNSIIKAERYEFDLSTSDDNEDKLIISLDGLSKLDTYFIKSYEFSPPYTSISQLRFYDKSGKRIDETAFGVH